MTAAAPSLPLRHRELAFVEVDVGPVVSMGGGPYGERRVVALTGGRVRGVDLNGVVVGGGADWQVARADGVLDIAAHYHLLLDDDARVEVTSIGLRHGPPDVLARLAAGDDVDPASYFFRTLVRFQTGAARLVRYNGIMAIAVGARRADRVDLTLHEIL